MFLRHLKEDGDCWAEAKYADIFDDQGRKNIDIQSKLQQRNKIMKIRTCRGRSCGRWSGHIKGADLTWRLQDNWLHQRIEKLIQKLIVTDWTRPPRVNDQSLIWGFGPLSFSQSTLSSSSQAFLPSWNFRPSRFFFWSWPPRCWQSQFSALSGVDKDRGW